MKKIITFIIAIFITHIAFCQVSPTKASTWNLNGNKVVIVKKFGTIDNLDVPVITNNVERMRIKNNGLIGVGLTTPTATFHVRSLTASSSDKVFLFENSSAIPIFSATSDGAIGMGVAPDSDFKFKLKNAEGRLVSFQSRSSTDNADFTVFNDSYVSIRNSLYVGAYFVTPAEKLTVAGRVRSTNSDIVVETNTRGFIIKDASNHYWRISVNTSGVLTTTDLGTSLPTE